VHEKERVPDRILMSMEQRNGGQEKVVQKEPLITSCSVMNNLSFYSNYIPQYVIHVPTKPVI